MHPSIKELIGSNSDHTLQMAKLTEGSGDHPFIKCYKIATLNMLNKCFDEAHCRNKDHPYSNNPASFNETDEQYVTRKVEQLVMISGILHAAKVDVIFLQETDVFCTPTGVLLTDPDQIEKLDRAIEIFVKALDTLGYMIEKSNPGDNMKGSITTIYKLDTFRPYGTKPYGCFDDPDRLKHAGYVVSVIKRSDGSRIDLINLHLDYTIFYDQVILDKMYKGIKDNVMIIMGGDTNKCKALMPIKMGPIMISSTVMKDKKTLHLTSMDDRVSSPQFADFDSFFISPSSPSSWVSIYEYLGDTYYVKPVMDGRFGLLQYRQPTNRESPVCLGQPIVAKEILYQFGRRRTESGAPFLDRSTSDSPYHGTVVETQRAAI